MFSQSFANNIRTVSGTVILFPDDLVLMCDTSAAPVIINLQAIAVNWNVNWRLYVVDASNNAAVNNITINAPAGYIINQGSAVTVTQNKGAATITIVSQTAYSVSYNYNPPTSSGTVTSVNASGANTGMSFSGGPITTAGTLTLSGTLVAGNGGTGISSYAKGDILVAIDSTTLVKLPVGSNGQILTADSAQTSGIKWAAPAAMGTVTSVDASGGSTGLNFAGGPITGAGTLTLSGTLIAINGGTGNSSYTKGDILVAVNSTTLVKFGVGTDGASLIADSAQTAGLRWGTPSGVVTSVNASGGTTGLSFSGGPITSAGILTLSGTLIAANGGTGNSSYTKGDILVATGSTTLVKLPIGSDYQVLTADAAQSSGIKWAYPTGPYFYAKKSLLSTDTALSIAPASPGNLSIINGQQIDSYTSETENGLAFNSSTGEFTVTSNGLYSLAAKITTRTAADNINATGWTTGASVQAFLVIGIIIERVSSGMTKKIVACSEKEYVTYTLTSDVNLECTAQTFQLQAEDVVYVTILNLTEYTIINLAADTGLPDCFIDFSIFKIS